jgi:O-antigen/teichoic acid export membrane protein
MLLSTVVGSLIFLALPSTRPMYALGGRNLFAITFIAASCLQTGVTFLGLVLVADRASSKLAVANVIPNLAKLASPTAFTFLGDLGSFISRTAYNLFSYIILAVVLVRRGHRFRLTFRMSAVRELGRFSMGMYVASTIGSLPQLLLPVVALSRLGAAGTAYWSIAYLIATLLYQLPSVITQALLPEISSRPAERRSLLRRAALLICGLVYPALAIAFVAAPIALTFFGHKYLAGSLIPVRWLIAAGFITSLNYVTGAVLFLAKKSGVMTIVNIVDAIIVLGLAGVWASSPTQVAIAWFIGDVANTVLFGLFAYIALREVSYRYEDLGGEVPLPAVPPVTIPGIPIPTSPQAAIGALFEIAERQQAARAAAERQRILLAARTTGPLDASSALYHAFDVLAAMSEQQRRAKVRRQPEDYRLSGKGVWTPITTSCGGYPTGSTAMAILVRLNWSGDGCAGDMPATCRRR